MSGATSTDVTNWANAYGLFNHTLRAKDDDTLAQLEQRECTYLVETAAMTIQWRSCTCLGGNCEPSIVPGLAELDAALGP
ncbi:MAG: hypothetical protein JRI23_19325 [Deltaproteobacteria bacterium]|nr:hypothetical protein [Deltaproteobacteria bacterium]MBW2534016.1 hypothetical protein [Deltaproteobacteria bacterium]